jgi:hypothetical protein
MADNDRSSTACASLGHVLPPWMRLVTIIFIVLPIIFVGGSLILFWVLVFIRLIFIAHGWISPACWLEMTQILAISLIVVVGSSYKTVEGQTFIYSHLSQNDSVTTG